MNVVNGERVTNSPYKEHFGSRLFVCWFVVLFVPHFSPEPDHWSRSKFFCHHLVCNETRWARNIMGCHGFEGILFFYWSYLAQGFFWDLHNFQSFLHHFFSKKKETPKLIAMIKKKGIIMIFSLQKASKLAHLPGFWGKIFEFSVLSL